MVARETNLVNAFETTLAAQLASGGTSINLSAVIDFNGSSDYIELYAKINTVGNGLPNKY